MAELPSGTVTFLFTDIEGSTRLLAELGREQYGLALAEHSRLLREVFAAQAGEVIDTQGDSFFVAFRTSVDAVAAAVAAQRAIGGHEWPAGSRLLVRMGIHTGEATVTAQRYLGLAVHRASRIGAVGHGGQVLLSNTTRELVEDELPTGVSVRDLGVHRLKDLERQEQLSQLVIDGLPDEFPPLRTTAEESVFAGKESELADAAQIAMTRPRLHRRRNVLVGALAGVIAAAVAVPIFALGGGSGHSGALSAVDENNVGVLDARSGRISSEVAVGDRPSGVAAGEGAIWVTADDGTVSRINPATGGVQPIQVGAAPSGVAVFDGFVWVANSSDGTVSKIDPLTNRLVKPIVVGNGPSAVAVGDGSVWVANALDGTVSRIDPGSGTVVTTLPASRYASGVAFGDGSLWVADESSDSVARINPATLVVSARIAVGSSPRRLAFGLGSLWVANSLGATVSRIDPTTNREAAAIPVGEEPSAIAVDSSGVWVSVEFGEKVVRIDPKKGEVAETIPIGADPQGVAVERGRVFVAARPSARSHRGGTLTVLNSPFPDPSVEGGAGNSGGGLNNALVAYKRVGGVESLQLVPDLATSLPVPTDGGRTYTFQLRSGVRYSNGEPLRPEDVRHSFERTFKLLRGRVGFGPIVGSATCVTKPTRCDLSRGIIVDDKANTVSFRLTEPFPYFLYDLLIPIVPASTPDTVVSPRALPVTGPYKVASYRPGREAILVRNRYFHVWSQAAQPDGFADRIVEKLSVPDAQALHLVERGSADVIVSPPARLVSQVGARHPSQLQTGLSLVTVYLFLNTRLPPFSDVRVRQALNYAIDRKRFARLAGIGTRPTCQVLPPDFPGYRPYCPYTVAPSGSGTWLGPDPVRARQLIAASHTKGMRVTVWWGKEFPNRAYAPYLVSLLRRLGYRAKLKWLPLSKYLDAVPDSRRRAQIGLTGWYADLPAASDFIDNLVSCHSFREANPTNPNVSEFCDPTVDALIKRALTLDASDPASANLLWMRIDHLIVDKAPLVALANPSWAFIVSKRVHNFHEQAGAFAPGPIALLEQIWVR